MMIKRNLTALCVLTATFAYAQFPTRLKDGLKTYLTADSAAFLKLNFISQVWVRYNENNPGSTVNGKLQANTYDVGIRRARVVLSGQLSKKVAFFFQFGQNNFNYLSARKTGAFIHDATMDYAFIPKKLSVGFGLHGWNGPGRFSNSSISSLLLLDPPLFLETTNDANDQFVRKLGMYAKGRWGKWDYRLSLSKPFITQTGSPEILNTNATYALTSPKGAWQGYVSYQFFDQEGNFGPSTVSTYLGKKRVLNVGAGFVQQKEAMWRKASSDVNADTLYHHMKLWAIDVFYEAPVNKSKGTALTIYSGCFVYDFGKGYLRNIAPMNPTNGVINGSMNGSGNGAPLIGTGTTLYLKSGYKFKDNLLGESSTLQAYSAIQYSRYDRLNEPMTVIDTGVNWLIHGHNSKFTLNYQSRPVFSATDASVRTRKGGWVLQYQVCF